MRPVLVFSVHTLVHVHVLKLCRLRRRKSEMERTAEKTERECSLRVAVLSVAGFSSIADKEETD